MGKTKTSHQQTLTFSLIFLLLNVSTFTCESRTPFACDPANPMTKSLPFCQVSLHIRDRVKDLVGRMTLQEKIGLLVNNASGVDRLGIKRYEWWSEVLHGISDLGPGLKFGGEYPRATSFPQVITTAATFNSSLWVAIGEAASDEGRAMYNGGLAGLTFWSPNVNIFRDPRWGRGQETPGEDPMLSARYASSYVKGLQGNGPGNKLKIAACCKHYTAYDLDFWNGFNRFVFDAKVSKQDLEETYDVPFKSCVYDGKVASVMCSYNKINGKPSCADASLLRDVIRGQWHLDGYIVSDCAAVKVIYEFQHYTKTAEDAVALSIKSGLDLDCGDYLGRFAEGAIHAGKLSEADVNQAVSNTLTVQMRLGMFDGPRQPYNNLGPKDLCTPAHQQLALEAAHQGIVLLQNNNRALPLSASRYRTVAVIGPNSDAKEAMLGDYFGIPCAYTSPLEGISKYAKTIHQFGCANVSCANNQQFGAAEAAASQADAVILVMGVDQSLEREYFDRTSLLLPGVQEELISRVAKASKGPVVLVLMSGGPFDVTFAKNNPKVSAILWAGYPGQAGGAGIADILFGKVNPGGKLPNTWYPQEFIVKIPMNDMAMHADPSRGYPGRTYRFYKGPVVYPFGFGLSYTNFRPNSVNGPSEMSLISTISKTLKNTNLLNGLRVSHADCETLSLGLNIEVENIGEMDGSHTLMVYATSPVDGKTMSEKRLVAFEKVHVMVGMKQSVAIHIDACKHLSVVDEFGIRRIPIGKHQLHIGDELKHIVSVGIGTEEIKS